MGTMASAQTAEKAASEPAEEELINVIGTRVVRDGYQSPTPVSVVGADEILRSATPNIADYVNTLPALSGSSTPRTTVAQVGAGRQGINSMNLRGIGDVRTLTLLDGRRVGGMINTGAVDVSSLPQQLITRVDVVTGGASASYGSDALSGVVNFVLDTKFTGFKGQVSGGVTTYGDNRNWQIALTYGTSFADGRGHFLLSGEVAHEDGIYDASNRSWTDAGWAYINNPTYTATNGQPRVLLRPGVGLTTSTLGGAIACSATSACSSLRGIAFGPGGTPYNLVFGPIVSDPIMAGGTLGDNNVRSGSIENSILPEQNRRNLFSRVSFDVADDWNLYAEGMYAYQDTDTRNYPPPALSYPAETAPRMVL
ncbi:outer membrane receptor protein involved in Fe transport [Polymorphobacter multimanifer]|uniref:Outer membrane receptor protein involved in Fe transport n=2 Tax=Polymorphobacter multimanifer TaxID=1070431 RepID=A0A841LCW5_9SPHN|nr:outer membrane receptor protein involved in Fe transport [Polymorphobacter multimanifer]